MIQTQIFVCGSGLLSHPVTHLFRLGADVAHGAPDAAVLGDKRLAVADCRTSTAAEAASWVGICLAAGRPILMLCPGADTLAGLRNTVGLVPDTASAALLVGSRRNPSGLVDLQVHALAYTHGTSDDETLSAASAAATEGGARLARNAPASCACTDFDELGSVFVTPEAVDTFKMIVERAMDPRADSPAPANTPPTGLKYFLHTYSTTVPFKYSGEGVSNGPGAATFSWTVWGFLNQTKTSNSQFLVVEGRIACYAGTLYKNDQCDRGWGNTFVMGTLTAPLNALSFVPTSGEGNFAGTVQIAISYKDPTGGYLIWNFASSVNNTVSSWACKSVSSGASLGAQWWTTSPFDGSNFNDTWDDAFTFWGHVEGFTGASTGTLDVNSVSAWQTNVILDGHQSVKGDFSWQGGRLWGSDCTPGVYWEKNGHRHRVFDVNPGFSVDFTPIHPA
jgi:hypothetical protein